MVDVLTVVGAGVEGSSELVKTFSWQIGSNRFKVQGSIADGAPGNGAPRATPALIAWTKSEPTATLKRESERVGAGRDAVRDVSFYRKLQS
jgi:hypothetical protein